MNNKKCQLCENYKDEYCEELELKPCYPENGCDYFSRPLEQEPKTGHWIEHEIKDTCRWLTCSVCGYEWVNKKENFCPNCGARMVEPQERNGEE